MFLSSSCTCLVQSWSGLINHRILVIGLTLRVNIFISDWQHVIYTITSKYWLIWNNFSVCFSSFTRFAALGSINLTLGLFSDFFLHIFSVIAELFHANFSRSYLGGVTLWKSSISLTCGTTAWHKQKVLTLHQHFYWITVAFFNSWNRWINQIAVIISFGF